MILFTLLQNQSEDIIDNTHSAWSELQSKLEGWVDSAILNLPNFILAILIFILFIIIANITAIGVSKIIKRTRAQESVRVVAIRIYKAIIILIGFFIAIGVMDLSTVLTSVLGAAGVVGLAVGLALQGTLNNTFSGVVLSFMPKIQIGDWIESNDFAGFVTDINLRNVTLKTADQNLVIIPNSKIVDSPFKNYSTNNRSVAILTCGVGYESDLELVENVTKKTLSHLFPQNDNENIDFFYTEFGDSSINYQVRFWIKESNAKDEFLAKHKAIKAIKKAYNEHQINIPFPIRTLDFGKNKFRSETLTIKLDKKNSTS